LIVEDELVRPKLLVLTVRNAKDLRSSDLIGKSDPIVKITFNGKIC
jgi:Ca2+-dependent lipid-binding protein